MVMEVREEVLARTWQMFSPLLPVKLVFMSGTEVHRNIHRLRLIQCSQRQIGVLGSQARILEMIKAPETFAIKLNYDF